MIALLSGFVQKKAKSFPKRPRKRKAKCASREGNDINGPLNDAKGSGSDLLRAPRAKEACA